MAAAEELETGRAEALGCSVIGSLFSGIGGFEIGLAKAGFETGMFCESDPAARLVLQARFPDVPIRPNIVQIRRLPRDVQILTAGFPCQNLSMAGDKAGISGSKSSLVDEMFRLLEIRRVPIVLIENVYFMLHLRSGSGMRHLVEGFEALGYDWAYRVLDTYWFGLPQRRRRVFLVASTELDPREVLLSDDQGIKHFREPSLAKPIGFYWTEGRSGVGTTGDALPPLKSGSGIGIPSPPAALWPDGGVRIPSIGEAERLQGFTAGWTGAADELNPRARWRLVGNAVSVPIAKWLGRRIARPHPYDATADTPLPKRSNWPNAAWGGSGRRWVSNASTRAIDCGIPSLTKFVRRPWKDLSVRATSGFLRRAQESTLNFPDEFLDRIEKYLEKSSL